MKLFFYIFEIIKSAFKLFKIFSGKIFIKLWNKLPLVHFDSTIDLLSQCLVHQNSLQKFIYFFYKKYKKKNPLKKKILISKVNREANASIIHPHLKRTQALKCCYILYTPYPVFYVPINYLLRQTAANLCKNSSEDESFCIFMMSLMVLKLLCNHSW